MSHAPSTDPGSLTRHRTDLLDLARCLARGSDAEDLVQETLMRSLDHRSAPRRRGAWLRQILRNAFRMRHRATARRRVREAVAPVVADSSDPEQEMSRSQLEHAIRCALARLDEPFRDALMGRYYEGLTAADVARKLGVPPGTVRWRIHEGLRRLRADLDARHGGRDEWFGAVLALGLEPSGESLPVTSGASFVGTWPKLTGLLVAGGVAVAGLTTVRGPSGPAAPVEPMLTHDEASTEEPAPPREPARDRKQQGAVPVVAPTRELSLGSLPTPTATPRRDARPISPPPDQSGALAGYPKDVRDGENGPPPGSLADFEAAVPLYEECYRSTKDKHPTLEPQVELRISFDGDEEVGPVISSIEPSGPLAANPEFVECIMATVETLEWTVTPPQDEHSTVMARLEMRFDEEKEEDNAQP